MPVLHFESQPSVKIEFAVAEGIIDPGVQLVNDDVVVLRKVGDERIAGFAAPIAAKHREAAAVDPGE